MWCRVMSQMLILVIQVCHSLTPTQLSLWHLPKEDPGVGCKLRSILSLCHLCAEGWSWLLSWSRVSWETETTWCWERAWILGTHCLSDQKLSCCLCAKPKLKAMWVSELSFFKKTLVKNELHSVMDCLLLLPSYLYSQLWLMPYTWGLAL